MPKKPAAIKLKSPVSRPALAPKAKPSAGRIANLGDFAHPPKKKK
jgi:hypothetical protein